MIYLNNNEIEILRDTTNIVYKPMCPDCPECTELTSITITENGVYTGAFNEVEVNVNSDAPQSNFDWDKIGYDIDDANRVNNVIENAIEYSSSKTGITNTNLGSQFLDNKRLVYAPYFNTSQATYMQSMFRNCYSLQFVPKYDTSNVTNFSLMFDGCYSLQNAPEFDTSKAISTGGMFRFCYNLQSVPEYNTSAVTNMGGMFYNCKLIETFPHYDMSNVTDCQQMFYGCENLRDIDGDLDTSSCTDMSEMFVNCKKLGFIYLPRTGKNKDFYNMFAGCGAMHIGYMDWSSAAYLDYVFNGCEMLIHLGKLNNLGKGFTNMSSNKELDLSSPRQLAYESKMNVINGLYDLNLVPSYRGTASVKFRNIDDLTNEDIAVATNKGWSITI